MEMNKWNLLFIFICLIKLSIAQSEQFGYMVEFTDKKGSVFSIENPEAFLSERAIQRRLKSQIAITETDLPVNKRYIDSLLTFNARLNNASKWLNSAVFLTNDIGFVYSAQACDFVKSVSLVYENASDKSAISSTKFSNEEVINDVEWGAATAQIAICNGTFLHQNGYMGQGIQVGVLDGGFYNANQIAGFDSLFQNNQVLGSWDFVAQDSNVFDDDPHGMNVLSIMGGNIPGQYLGSGSKASYWLLLTENVSTEYLIEEENWIAGAEFADSAGCDIITASLGYSLFDNPEMDHTYSDLDGKKLRITQAANMAFDRGILLINSAGNSGNEPWYYITAPSDGEHVLCIGAIDSLGDLASFSSHGPSADGRTKPDIVAQGFHTALINSVGQVSRGNGTSFSCPLVTGMAASLWSAFPEKSNVEIYEAIIYCSSQYFNPDNDLGYGIPDFEKAYYRLQGSETSNLSQAIVNVFPNPFDSRLYIALQKTGGKEIVLELINNLGSVVFDKKISLSNHNYHQLIIDLPVALNRGIYYLKISDKNSQQTKRIVKL
jgi:subtilisin family serine protease